MMDEPMSSGKYPKMENLFQVLGLTVFFNPERAEYEIYSSGIRMRARQIRKDTWELSMPVSLLDSIETELLHSKDVKVLDSEIVESIEPVGVITVEITSKLGYYEVASTFKHVSKNFR